MKKHNTRGQLIVLAILLMGLAGVLWVEEYRDSGLPFAPGPIARPGGPAAAQREAPGSVAEAERAGKPVEEIHESPDTETTLERLLPRASIGHSEGLHRVSDPLHLGSSAVAVVDANSKELLYGKNPDAVLPMASVTKLMMGLVTLEAKLPMDEPITITEEDVDRERMSRSRMRVGAVLSRAEALRLALMSSENRAAHALGRTYPGGLQAFVEAMNRKAKQLGMTHTTYVDPTGLSEKNQSSAHDLATLVLAASSYPLLREYSTTPEHRTVVAGRILVYRNSDPLLRDPAWTIDLQKTGYIVEAGHCVVMRTRAYGRDVAMVVLDAGDNRTRSADARRLRRWVELGADDNAVKLALAEPARHPAVARDAKRAHPQAVAAKGEKTARSAKSAKSANSVKGTKQAKASTRSKETHAKAQRSSSSKTASARNAAASKKGRVRAEFSQQAHGKKAEGSQG
ncbi:MAG TPA: D-alanyl-D-alanine endopeptidase [Ramlibacter sp.]|uniref:D-alanyl-D-alanine endopeptidase n=1 Tax=Ramlibacter sp. TaxID=1917967 RepID=UPI002BEA3F04|nr:D-alanyl-D-alanine endopeptidase [Ramlibacter sp.]HVZ46008.1 D-alanyl-D-alanine endopeptidase [Ramlibacter sp.]